MWGRIDGSKRLIDLLLDVDQLRRLTNDGDAQAVATLAGRLATVAIPLGSDDRAYDEARRLAFEAYHARDLPQETDAGPASSDARTATGAERPRLVAAWRQRLADSQGDDLAQAVLHSDPDALERLRADIRRRLHRAILEEEIPGLVAASVAERGPAFDVPGLLAEPDRGLRRLVPAELGAPLRKLELFQGAEHSAANALFALGRHGEGTVVRSMARTTGGFRRLLHAFRLAAGYIRQRL
jgi:hypothetical protein